MAAAYAKKPKACDAESVRVHAESIKLSESLNTAAEQALLLAKADEDAYLKLQETWQKDCVYSQGEVAAIKADALQVPVDLFNVCHEQVRLIAEFIPMCNKNIISDAKVSINLLSGSARASFQTILVNNPPEQLQLELKAKLKEIETVEKSILPQ